MICTAAVPLPAFGGAAHCPSLPEHVLRRRIEETIARIDAASLDVLAVYADREHRRQSGVPDRF